MTTTPTIRPNGLPRPPAGNNLLIHRDTLGGHRKGAAVKKPIVAGIAGLVVMAGAVLALILAGVGKTAGKPQDNRPTLSHYYDARLAPLVADESQCTDLACARDQVDQLQAIAQEVVPDARRRNASEVADSAQQIIDAANSWHDSCYEWSTSDGQEVYQQCVRAAAVIHAGGTNLLDAIHKFDGTS